MKYLLAFLMLLACSACYAKSCENPNCKHCNGGKACDCPKGCDCSKALTEGRVALPSDSSKLTVTVFAKNEAQAKSFIAANPTITSYKAGNHYNLYTSSNPLVKTRFQGVKIPSAYVQKSNGAVVWSTESSTNCPLFGRWRHRNDDQKQDQKQEESVDESDNSDEAPAPSEPNPWLFVGLAVLAAAGGAGSKLWEEVKSK